METADKPSTETYQHHYGILKEVSETLRNQKDPDIDALVPLVERASVAYRACQERIDRVEAMLQEILGEAATNA